MPSIREIGTPVDNVDAAMRRVHDALIESKGATPRDIASERALCKFIGLPLGSLRGAKARNAMPLHVLLHLLMSYNVSPGYVLEAKGPKLVQGADTAAPYSPENVLRHFKTRALYAQQPNGDLRLVVKGE